MDDGFELALYLPTSYKREPDNQYIQFLWETYQANFEKEKYQFAYLSLHMLFMSFVYFNVWQIKQHLEDDFRKGLIFKGNALEKKMMEASSPFVFHVENEASIFSFLKLIGCDKQKIGTYKKLVELRNNISHSNGNIYFDNKRSHSEKVQELLRCTEEIQGYSKSIIQDIYRQFLLESWNEELRPYIDIQDQIREELIHKYYLSEADIKFCLDFDIESLSGETNYKEISELHDSFCVEYTLEEYDEDYCEVCSDVHERLSIIDFYPGGNLIDERGQENTGAEIEIAECGYCSTTHFKCIECGTTNAVWDYNVGEEKECEAGCGLTYMVSESFDSDAISEGYTFRVMHESI